MLPCNTKMWDKENPINPVLLQLLQSLQKITGAKIFSVFTLRSKNKWEFTWRQECKKTCSWSWEFQICNLIYFFPISLLRQMLSAVCFHLLSGALLAVKPELCEVFPIRAGGNQEKDFQKTWFLDFLTVVKVTSEALQTAVIQNSSVLSLPISVFSVNYKTGGSDRALR